MNGDLEESIHNDKIIELVKIEGIFFGGGWLLISISSVQYWNCPFFNNLDR